MSISKPNPGDPLSAGRQREHAIYSEANRPIPGVGIDIRRTAAGSVISLSSRAAEIIRSRGVSDAGEGIVIEDNGCDESAPPLAPCADEGYFATERFGAIRKSDDPAKPNTYEITCQTVKGRAPRQFEVRATPPLNGVGSWGLQIWGGDGAPGHNYLAPLSRANYPESQWLTLDGLSAGQSRKIYAGVKEDGGVRIMQGDGEKNDFVSAAQNSPNKPVLIEVAEIADVNGPEAEPCIRQFFDGQIVLAEPKPDSRRGGSMAQYSIDLLENDEGLEYLQLFDFDKFRVDRNQDTKLVADARTDVLNDGTGTDWRFVVVDPDSRSVRYAQINLDYTDEKGDYGCQCGCGDFDDCWSSWCEKWRGSCWSCEEVDRCILDETGALLSGLCDKVKDCIDLGGIYGRIDELAGRVDRIDLRLDELIGQVNDHEGRIAALETQLDFITQLKIKSQ